MSLQNLILEGKSIHDISEWLNQQNAADRLLHIRSLNKKAQKRLYTLAIDSAPLGLDYFAPSDQQNTEVIHEGKNSLPAFTLFQKRFCRRSDGSVVGYNHGSTMGIVGPGYFIAKETRGNKDWEDKGSVVIDYYEVPESKPIDSWPEVKGNGQGLQRLVYYKMHDFMRKVSDHVSIGVAYKGGSYSGNYFILCRQD